MKMNLKIFFTVVFLGASITSLPAQDQDIKASAPAVVRINQAFNYTISGEVQGEVSFRNPEGIRIMRGPSQMVSYQSTNVNGRLQNVMQVSYTYLLVAEKEGEFEIPPAELRSGGKIYRTNPVKIKAIKGTAGATGSAAENTKDEPAPVLITLNPSRTDIYEGEQIVVETRIYTRERIRLSALNNPEFTGFWVETLDPDNFASNQTLNGINYRTQVIKRDLLTAQKKGTIDMGSASVDVDIQRRIRTNRPSSPFDDFFDDPFFNSPGRYETVSRTFNSKPLRIEVKPLPEGAPSGFNGAVGALQVQATTDADSVGVNEAINLKITLRGSGNLSLISPPEIDFPPDLEVFDPKRTNKLTHSISGTEGSVVFEYLIIPRFPGEYRIAPVEYAWFNPGNKQYQKYSSPGFTFQVGGEAGANAEDMTGSGFFREDVRNLNADIRFIKISPGNMQLVTRLTPSLTWVYIFYPGGLLLLVGFVFIWRKHSKKKADIFGKRSRKARKMANRRLSLASRYMKTRDDKFYEEVLNAVWGYLGDRLRIDAAELSRETVSEVLRSGDVPDDLLEELIDIIEICEQSRYSPQKSDQMESLYERTSLCIENLEQKIK